MTVRGDDNDNCFMDTAWYYSSYCYPASFSITAQIDLNKKGFDLKVRYMFFDIYPRKPKKKKQKRSKKAELPEDSFEDFEEFEDNIEESLPIPQTDDTPDKTGEVSEQIVEAKPEK